MKFIYRTVFVVLIFFVLYGILLKTIAVEHNQFQNFRQENKIKAENFTFSKIPYETIIVGSSMSEGLLLDSKKKCLTLNFIGGSSLTGLALIKNAKLLPKIIIVETNWLERPVDNDLILKRGTLSYYIKSIFPFFLEKNQPVNIIADYLAPQPTVVNGSKMKANVKKNIEINIAKENSPVNFVKSYIQYFQNKGVKIYLMEIPVDQKLYVGKRAQATRKSISNTIHNVTYIPSYPNAVSFKTFDGYHLLTNNRKEYSDFLIDFLSRQRK